MPDNAARLYQEDFVRWTGQQAAGPREAAGLDSNLLLDWENLAEESDSLGRSHRRELRSRIAVIIEHLMKLEYSPETDPRPSWIDTIGRERRSIEDMLDESPSLSGEVAGMLEHEMPRTIRLVARNPGSYGEATRELAASVGGAAYTEEQGLGDWFPGDTSPLPGGGERE